MHRRILKLPSGSGLTIHYKKTRDKASRCTRCGRMLSGVPMKSSSKISRLSTSKKRPERMFGGELCHTCLQAALKQAVRSAIPV